MPRGRPKKNETEKETVGTTVRTTLVFDLSKDNHVLVYDYLNSLQRGGKTDAVVNAIIDKATKQHEMQEAQSILKEELQNTIAEEIRSCIPQIVDAVTSSIQKNGIAVAAPASNYPPPKHYRHTNHQHNSQNRRSTASYFRRSDACITVSRYVWRLIICRDWLSLFYRDA